MTDEINCPDCGGDGKDDCDNCGGHGTVKWDEQTDLGDPDEMAGSSGTCPGCKGTGKSEDDCPRCEGTGAIPAEDGDEEEEDDGCG
jgi:DnaJ-class molecular chaperone